MVQIVTKRPHKFFSYVRVKYLYNFFIEAYCWLTFLSSSSWARAKVEKSTRKTLAPALLWYSLTVYMRKVGVARAGQAKYTVSSTLRAWTIVQMLGAAWGRHTATHRHTARLTVSHIAICNKHQNYYIYVDTKFNRVTGIIKASSYMDALADYCSFSTVLPG